jgi:uncharacterized paraquat-inducible protein A
MAGVSKFACPYCDHNIVPKKPIKTDHIECRRCHKQVKVTDKLVRRSWGNFLSLCIFIPMVLTYLVYNLLIHGFRSTFDAGLIIITLVLAFIPSVFIGQLLGLIIGSIEAKKLMISKNE